MGIANSTLGGGSLAGSAYIRDVSKHAQASSPNSAQPYKVRRSSATLPPWQNRSGYVKTWRRVDGGNLAPLRIPKMLQISGRKLDEVGDIKVSSRSMWSSCPSSSQMS